MALTQDQWYQKLRSWVPTWFFEVEGANVAWFEGLAAELAASDATANDHFRETFISLATANFLDTHGDERSVDRLTIEADPPYSVRVRNIVNRSNVPAIKALVDALLINGECSVIENYTGMLYMSRDSYISRHEIFTHITYDTFSVVVPNQLHDPFSFLSREDCLDRELYEGALESNLALFEQIAETVNKAKAFGTLYYLVETKE